MTRNTTGTAYNIIVKYQLQAGLSEHGTGGLGFEVLANEWARTHCSCTYAASTATQSWLALLARVAKAT